METSTNTLTRSIDPVCRRKVEPGLTRVVTIYEGRSYWFCSVECRFAFESNPLGYVESVRGKLGSPLFVTLGLWLCMLPVVMVLFGLIGGLWWAFTGSFILLAVMLAVCLGLCLRRKSMGKAISNLQDERLGI